MAPPKCYVSVGHLHGDFSLSPANKSPNPIISLRLWMSQVIYCPNLVCDGDLFCPCRMFSLAIFRFMLGMGEGFNWPGASKTVAEWFPAEERGLAVAIFDSGSSVGAVIAPPFVAFIAYAAGWRYAFLVAGSLGFFWLLVWMYFYHPLDSHPRLSASEREFIKDR